jgi:hypothetical protein
VVGTQAANHPTVASLSNQRLAEQLRRLLDDWALAESRCIRTLIGEIKRLALQHGEALAAEATITTIEGDPQVMLVMESLCMKDRPNVCWFISPFRLWISAYQWVTVPRVSLPFLVRPGRISSCLTEIHQC